MWSRKPDAVSFLLLVCSLLVVVYSCPSDLTDHDQAFNCAAYDGPEVCIADTATLAMTLVSAGVDGTATEVVDTALDTALAVTVKCAMVTGYTGSTCSGTAAATATCIGCGGAETVTTSGIAASTVGGDCPAGAACSCTDSSTKLATVSSPYFAATSSIVGGVGTTTAYTASTDQCTEDTSTTCATTGVCSTSGVWSVNSGSACTLSSGSCSCTSCTCSCTGNTCGSSLATTTYKEWSATGGGSCAVAVTCSHGFYDGGTYTAAPSSLVNVQLMQDTTEISKVTGGASTASNGILTGATPTVSNGVLTFGSLAVHDAVAAVNKFKLKFTAGTLASFANTAIETAEFQVRPVSFTYTWGSTPTNFVAGASLTHTISTSLTVAMQNADQTTIDGYVKAADLFDVVVYLQTGGAAGRSDIYGSPADAAVQTDIVAGTDNKCVFPDDTGTCVFASGSITILKHAGLYYRLNLASTLFSGAITSIATSFFRLDPASLQVQDSSGTAFADAAFPTVVKVDGTASDTLDSDGFPVTTKVALVDSAGATLTLAACTACVVARLVKCTDNVPVSTSNYAYTQTTCSSVAQALCATSSSDGATCLSGQWLPTLGGTTVSDVVAGVASFAGLQARYVLGSGYRLMFSLNPYSAAATFSYVARNLGNTAVELNSAHSNTNGRAYLPSASWATPGNSFMIRPYAIEVVQNPGGDGVDLGAGAGDEVAGTPDGVGVGMVFRVQPAVVLKGNGYYFDKNWAQHGHTPITAAVLVTSCTQNNCNAACDAAACAVTSVSIASDSTATSGVSPAAVSATAGADAATKTSTFGSAPSGNPDVECKYLSVLGKVGYIWRDLKAYTSVSGQGNENVQLQYLVGLACDLLASIDTKCTAVSSKPFDIFSAPNPPVNVRAYSYGPLGFRLEFEPGFISRLKPLSGFIVEVDTCTQSGAATGACAQKSPIYASTDGLATELGSDYNTAGGHTEEIQIAWAPTTAGELAAGTVTFTPRRTLLAGDVINIPLGLPGILGPAGPTTCTPTGNSASLFTVSFAGTTSIISLTVAASKTVMKGVPVTLVLPTGCNIYNPSTDPTSTAYVGAVGTGVATGGYGTLLIAANTPTLPTFVVAPVIGNSDGRFDNCQGTGCDAFGASTHFALRSIQDASSMDLTWSGALRYSSQGVLCSSSPSVGVGTFPSNRYCTTSSNGYIAANAGGDNGAPIGSNPGSGSATTYGSGFTVDNDACRRFAITNNNPCALSIGSDWTVGVGLTYDSTTAPTVITLTFRYPRTIRAGSTLKVRIASTAGAGTLTTSTVITDADTSVAAAAITTWTAAYTQNSGSGVLTVTMVSAVSAGSQVVCAVSAFTGMTTTSPPSGAIGEIQQGTKTTLFFRSGGVRATYTAATGAPVQSYNEAVLPFTITEGNLYSFRVYAYNGRFRSSPTTTSVVNRAISPPANVAYLPQIAVDSMGVSLVYSVATASTATQIQLAFTPRIALSQGTLISLALPGFSHASSFVTITNSQILSATGTTTNGVTTYAASTASTIVTAASWTTNTSMLVLTVATAQTVPANAEFALFIAVGVGILNPPASIVKTNFQIANISSLTIDWTSPFPMKTSPRLGFVVQYSSDASFAQDLQTVTFPDAPNRGVVDSTLLTYLAADLTDIATTVTLPAEAYTGQYGFLVNKFIKIDSEYMLVTAVAAPALTVIRGRAGSSAAAHPVAVGVPADVAVPCACTTGATSGGLGTCSCTQVYVAYIGATTPGRGDGKDKRVGSGCLIGGTFCNPDEFDFSLSASNTGFRTHQSARIVNGINDAADWLAGGCLDGCSSVSLDVGSTLNYGREYGNPTTYGTSVVAAPGNPNFYPMAAETTVAQAISATTTTLVLSGSPANLLKKYIKIDNEFMYVERVTRGVSSVSFASNAGLGCTAGDGNLDSVSSVGSGFAGTFTVSGTGAINAITITNTGTGYTAGAPVIRPSTATTCTTNPSLAVTLSSNIVVVQRGAFGSTAATHASAATVYKIWWPTQGTIGLPGMQYFFRVAAYNSAGFSNWKYYNMNYDNHDPAILPTKGMVDVEFIITGMGISAANHTIYFGQRNTDGSPDWSRMRECGAVQLLDFAGTRVKCVAPAWEGRQHDILFRYASGMIEKLQFLTNGIKYKPPSVSNISPALVASGQPVTVTISGDNFGNADSNRTAYLDGGSGDASIIPCVPLTFVSDTVLVCTLSPKTTQKLKGNIVVSVGSDLVGGKQLSATSIATLMSTIPDPVTVSITLSLDISTIPSGSSQEAAFIASFKSDIVAALKGGIKEDQINVTSITAGSIIVAFVILPNPNSISSLSPAQIAASIVQQASNPSSLLLSGSVTGAVTGVSVPPGVLEQAAALQGATLQATSKPSYFTACQPRSFSAFDMEVCYDCCTFKCETGTEIPSVGGVPVLAGYRAQACQSQCLNNCGYYIPISVLQTMG